MSYLQYLVPGTCLNSESFYRVDDLFISSFLTKQFFEGALNRSCRYMETSKIYYNHVTAYKHYPNTRY